MYLEQLVDSCLCSAGPMAALSRRGGISSLWYNPWPFSTSSISLSFPFSGEEQEIAIFKETLWMQAFKAFQHPPIQMTMFFTFPRIGFNAASDIRFKSLSRFLQVWIGPEIFAPKWFHFWILCHCCHIRSQPDVRGVTRGEVTWEARQAVPMAGACLDSQRNPHKPHLCPVSFSPMNQRQHA